VAFNASDAVTALVAIDDDVALAALVANEALTAFKTYDAVVAYDELAAFRAQLEVPNNEPVIPSVTVRDPDTIELFSAIRPLRVTNSFAIYIVLCFTVHRGGFI